MDENQVLEIIKTTSNLPLVKINREEFLTSEFGDTYSSILKDILDKGPYNAGVPLDVIDKKVKSSINLETTKATAISFAAGIPGGFAMVGTIPADITQFMGHSMRIVQKLVYLSGMPGFSSINDMTDEDAYLVLVYLGIMFGSGSAITALNQVAKHIGNHALKTLPKIALTKTVGYPALKQLLKFVGVKLTKDTFAKGVSKVVPILGGIASGGITLASIKIMSNRLYKELAKSRFDNSNGV